MPKIPPPKSLGLDLKRRERLGVNVFDLDRLDQSLRKNLLGGNLDLGEAIWFGRKYESDECFVAFSCDLLSAACICDLLRNYDRQLGDVATRIYLRKGRITPSWYKLPPTLVLTEMDGEICRLNPVVFPSSENLSVAPAQTGQVVLGRKLG